MEKEKISTFRRVVELVKVTLIWLGALYLWFLYAYNTLDRSEAAFQANGGYGPMLSGYSVFILGVLLTVLLSKLVFSRKKNLWSIATKCVVIIIMGFGLWMQLSYDPDLSKLRAYKAPKPDYTGTQLFDAINSHRKSIGVQELRLEETFCGNLVERWMAVKNPNNGHKGFDDWWADKKLIKDPYGQINELYATAATAERVIELWTGSPGHKIVLEDPDYNVTCTYAAEGTGVAIIGSK